MKKFTTIRKWLKIAIVAELIVLLSLSGVVYAKYTTGKTLTGSVTINAELGTITLYEHNVSKDDYGQYHLTDEVLAPNTGITYNTVIPGLDIPKDPYVVITDKTTIPVYVFLIVDNKLPSTMTYELEDHWQAVHSNVYVYSQKDGENWVPVKLTSTPANPISVLKNERITVSQNLKGSSFPDGGATLTFSACMGQVGSYTDAQSVYNFIKNP